jgi:acylphosphatase
MAEIAVRLIIEGRVQGVGFRIFTVEAALRRTVRGWVRNRRDGAVEALLIGADRDVEAVIAACRQGPRLAHVANVTAEPATDDGTSGFHERPTV